MVLAGTIYFYQVYTKRGTGALERMDNATDGGEKGKWRERRRSQPTKKARAAQSQRCCSGFSGNFLIPDPCCYRDVGIKFPEFPASGCQNREVGFWIFRVHLVAFALAQAHSHISCFVATMAITIRTMKMRGFGVPWFPVAAAALGAASISCRAAAEFEAGTAVQEVVPLTKANFKLAVSDPANPFWLLKFYAPWYVRRCVVGSCVVGTSCVPSLSFCLFTVVYWMHGSLVV